MFSELEKWLRGRGISETKINILYAKVVAEKGFLAQIVRDLTVTVFPLAATIEVDANTAVSGLRRAKSGRYAAWLLSQPEPDPKDLEEFLFQAKRALPNLKDYFLEAVKPGPRFKAGGRPPELEDSETREEIRAKIKERRKPGTNLDDLFEEVAREYEAKHSAHKNTVSAATIKRIWYGENQDRAEDTSKDD